MAEARKDDILEIIDRALLVFNLSCGQSHGEIVQGLMDQEVDVKFETNGEQVGYLTQSLKGTSNFIPLCGNSLSQWFSGEKIQRLRGELRDKLKPR